VVNISTVGAFVAVSQKDGAENTGSLASPKEERWSLGHTWRWMTNSQDGDHVGSNVSRVRGERFVEGLKGGQRRPYLRHGRQQSARPLIGACVAVAGVDRARRCTSLIQREIEGEGEEGVEGGESGASVRSRYTFSLF
jgi:hypothetical protein